MLTNVMYYGAKYGIALVSLVVLMFILNRAGLIAWFWWASRSKGRIEDSTTRNIGMRTSSDVALAYSRYELLCCRLRSRFVFLINRHCRRPQHFSSR